MDLQLHPYLYQIQEQDIHWHVSWQPPELVRRQLVQFFIFGKIITHSTVLQYNQLRRNTSLNMTVICHIFLVLTDFDFLIILEQYEEIIQ